VELLDKDNWHRNVRSVSSAQLRQRINDTDMVKICEKLQALCSQKAILCRKDIQQLSAT